MGKKNNMFWLVAIGAAFALLLFPNLVQGAPLLMSAEDLIISFEGFSPTPYWDVKRYSWGYGTQAPGANGRISEQQARAELGNHVQNDLSYLAPLIKVDLSNNQWAALLSFSYNLGTGNADNLVPNINAGDNDALRAQWLLYNKADGMYNDALAKRRAAEWQVWIS